MRLHGLLVACALLSVGCNAITPPPIPKGTAAGKGPAAAKGAAPAPLGPVDAPIVLRSDDLRQQHATDSDAAVQKYTRKRLQVTGPVTAVLQESPLIGISFGSPQDSVPAVICEMNRGQLEELTQLRRGQTVTVLGDYQGLIQGSIGIGNCVLLSKRR